ncbi:hypothetical protein SAMN05216267_102945 [Actinacidiphila rubida]|uniref:Uncharacterized protein n=1 Tax=Actinacidiphila rubida TaxID=310780 RepID=A0A1H8QD64_9ACTN|nr:hypothetical protein SAMN05216267_102945 [Actinacidiphila rubida]
MATSEATMVPSECATTVTVSRRRASSSARTSSRIDSNAYAPGCPLSPCPRRSGASVRHPSAASPAETARHEPRSSPSACSRSTGGPSGGPSASHASSTPFTWYIATSPMGRA